MQEVELGRLGVAGFDWYGPDAKRYAVAADALGIGRGVDGDSMAPRCRDGDIVLLSPDEPAREGRPAVVKLKGQIGATCKLYVPHGDRLHLVPVNENYPTTEHALDAVEWALAVLWRVALAPES